VSVRSGCGGGDTWAPLAGHGLPGVFPVVAVLGTGGGLASGSVPRAGAYDLLGEDVWRKRILDALLCSTVLVAALGVLQYAGLLPGLFPTFEDYGQRVYSVFGNQDLYGGYLAIGIPLLVRRFLTRTRLDTVALLGIVVLLAGLLISGSRSAWLAVAVGVLIAIPYRHVTRLGTAMLGGVCMTIVVLTVWLAPAATSHRFAMTLGPEDHGGRLRLWFWDGTLRMVRDAPIAGQGLGNYGYWSPRYLGEALHAPGGHTHAHNELHTVRAHCEPLEILAEAGLIGSCCWLWMLVRLIRCRGPEWGGLAALLTFSLFNAAFHSAPHALAGLLLAGMLLAQRGTAVGAEAPGESLDAAYGLAALTIMMSAFFMWAVLLPSYWLQAAEDRYLAGKPCLPQYERVVEHPWPNARAREEYGVALSEAGRLEEAYYQFERALDGRDTGSLYLALGALAQSLGDHRRARQWLDACFYRWPSSAALWEVRFQGSPPHERKHIRERAARWGVMLDKWGRAQGPRLGVNTPKIVTSTSTPSSPPRTN